MAVFRSTRVEVFLLAVALLVGEKPKMRAILRVVESASGRPGSGKNTRSRLFAPASAASRRRSRNWRLAISLPVMSMVAPVAPRRRSRRALPVAATAGAPRFLWPNHPVLELDRWSTVAQCAPSPPPAPGRRGAPASGCGRDSTRRRRFQSPEAEHHRVPTRRVGTRFAFPTCRMACRPPDQRRCSSATTQFSTSGAASVTSIVAPRTRHDVRRHGAPACRARCQSRTLPSGWTTRKLNSTD